jgi:hypothetical protein
MPAARSSDRRTGLYNLTENMTMRILCMHKVGPRDEAGEVPSQDLIENMGKLIGEAAERGLLLAGEGLKPTSQRFRLAFRNGRWDVTKGPWPGENELPQRIVIVKVANQADAHDWAKRYGEAVGATTLELGPVTEEWDLGFGERPADAPYRFMILHLADAAFEAGKPPTKEQQQGYRTVIAAMQKAGVLQLDELLLPSKHAVRLDYRDNVRTRTDGPFTESKELIGGFAMLQMRSFDEMVVWADRYVRILGGNCQIDLRVAADAGAAAGGAS